MKSFSDSVGAKVDNKVEILGTFNFQEVETTEEAISLFGEASVVNLINRAYAQGQQNLAREACKKEGEGKKTTEEIQAMITAYRPGTSVTRFSIKNYLTLYQTCVEAAVASGDFSRVQAAAAIYRDGSPEEAFNFLLEA